MATVSLKINIVKSNNVKTMQVGPPSHTLTQAFTTLAHTHTHIHLCTTLPHTHTSLHYLTTHTFTHPLHPSHTLPQFEETMIVYDACRLIRERVPDAASGQRE